MTATAHALVGGAIAASISNPAIGLPLAAISHPLMDLIPHWDFARNWKTKPKLKLFTECVLDLVLGVFLTYLIFGQSVTFWYLAAALFVSEMWDIFEAPYWFLKWRFPPFSTIYEIQHRMQSRTNLKWGLLTQVVTVLVVVVILQNFA